MLKRPFTSETKSELIYLVRSDDGIMLFLDRAMYLRWLENGGPEFEEFSSGVWTLDDLDDFDWNWIPKEDD